MTKFMSFFLMITFCFKAYPDAQVEILLKAAKNNDTKKVRELIRKGVNVNGKGSAYGETPLIMAIGKEGRDEIVNMLIKAGADVNLHSGNFGTTPLQMAIIGPNMNHMKILLKAGAKIYLKDYSGRDAFRFAVRQTSSIEPV